RLGETPVAMVELRESASTDADTLVGYLRTRLARYEIPVEIAIVDTIPRTPSGKADLSAIQRFFNQSAAQRDHARCIHGRRDRATASPLARRPPASGLRR